MKREGIVVTARTLEYRIWSCRMEAMDMFLSLNIFVIYLKSILMFLTVEGIVH